MTELVLSQEWVQQLNLYSKLIIGFSGGLDSTVLLHLLHQASLSAKLTAVYVNHGLSPNALAWQKHCEQFCTNFNIEFLAQAVQVKNAGSKEEAARIARYEVFRTLLDKNQCLVLAHHKNDQAETLLLHLFRGTGIDGLSAMKALGSFGAGELARPLLAYSRQQLEAYAEKHALKWIEDESNQDLDYSRNYIRHRIMPLLAQKWPALEENLARTALHCQQAKCQLNDLALLDNQGSLDTPFLSLSVLKGLRPDRIMNLLRSWLKAKQVPMPSSLTLQRISTEVIFAASDAAPEVSWAGFQIVRYRERLFIQRKKKVKQPVFIDWLEFPNPLVLQEHECFLSAIKSQKGLVIPEKAQVQIRFRQGGEQLRLHGQTKELKKLFQEWAVPPWERGSVPLIYINNELAVVLSYAIADPFYSESCSNAWDLTYTFRGYA